MVKGRPSIAALTLGSHSSLRHENLAICDKSAEYNVRFELVPKSQLISVRALEFGNQQFWQLCVHWLFFHLVLVWYLNFCSNFFLKTHFFFEFLLSDYALLKKFATAVWNSEGFSIDRIVPRECVPCFTPLIRKHLWNFLVSREREP